MLIENNDIPVVAMDFMNVVHKEDVEIINVLFNLILVYDIEQNEENYRAINTQYKKWLAHTVAHFEGEEVKMRELRFPPYHVHKGEHDNALIRMNTVFKNWEQSRNIQALKMYLIEEVPVWLTNHIRTMDTVTAMFFSTGLSPCSVH